MIEIKHVMPEYNGDKEYWFAYINGKRAKSYICKFANGNYVISTPINSMEFPANKPFNSVMEVFQKMIEAEPEALKRLDKICNADMKARRASGACFSSVLASKFEGVL